MFLKHEVPKLFIGRQGQLKWLAKLLFSHRHWQLPFIVTGPPGCGKTALVAKFLQLHQEEVQGYWASITRPSQVADFYTIMEKNLRSNGRAQSVVVVLDDVGYLDDKVLINLSKMIQNYKIVQAVDSG